MYYIARCFSGRSVERDVGGEEEEEVNGVLASYLKWRNN
jgi:hypothetical protein